MTESKVSMVMVVGLVACVSGDGQDDSDRGRELTGKADTGGSCVDTGCTGRSSGGCYCDDVCSHFKDCCADRVALCEADLTVERLMVLTHSQLEAVFATGSAPEVSELQGKYAGRALANAIFDIPFGIQGAINSFFADNFQLWLGKMFYPLGPDAGIGYNRLQLDAQREFARFITSVRESRRGDGPTLELNYDVDTNWPGVRNLRDEVREIAPGLLLGRAYFHSLAPLPDAGLFWFGLSAE